ncbi:MAG: Glutamine synthetase type II, eukaryotic [Ktedonobacterales bacterium]|jgi:predicted TIM-barrel fold metal-dependent hydrolase|nr:MAG: Glutamine synthetase type II, eukaryotic [Ktedonobacterales bacterium]
MDALDLSAIPVVDNHCHGLYAMQAATSAQAWRRHFTESGDAGMRDEHTATTLFYHRLLREMAAFLGCAADEASVVAARERRDARELIAALLRAARIETLLVDQGYPPRGLVMPDAEVAALAGCRVAPMLRLETLMQELIAAHNTLDAVEEALRVALADVRAAGYVALKSIAAYRTGLAIRVWDRHDAGASFMEARREVEQRGVLRLTHQPLLDTLLHVAFAEAARQEVPVQFHTGYGDTDADLLLANPLHLRAVLETRAYRGMPVVLLHECYPYTREGGYLAAVYENVYLDLSYGIPFLSYAEMLAFTRAALGVAPVSKLLYSSDGVGVPELHWSSAHTGRRVLGQVLGESVAYGDLSAADAEAAGRAILRENALRLYRL